MQTIHCFHTYFDNIYSEFHTVWIPDDTTLCGASSGSKLFAKATNSIQNSPLDDKVRVKYLIDLHFSDIRGAQLTDYLTDTMTICLPAEKVNYIYMKIEPSIMQLPVECIHARDLQRTEMSTMSVDSS